MVGEHFHISDLIFFQLEVTQYKVEQPLLHDMKLQEKEENQDKKHTGRMIRKNPKIIGAC